MVAPVGVKRGQQNSRRLNQCWVYYKMPPWVMNRAAGWCAPLRASQRSNECFAQVMAPSVIEWQ
jgi:hypothetical protein